jgi:hypothetical protein
MAKSRFGRRFHDLKYFKGGFFYHIPWIRYKLEVIITKNCRKTSIWHHFIILKQIQDNYVPNISTCTLLAPSFKICRLFLEKKHCQRVIAWLCRSMCFQMFMIFFFAKFKVSIKYHIHVNLSRGDGVVYLTVLALCFESHYEN